MRLFAAAVCATAAILVACGGEPRGTSGTATALAGSPAASASVTRTPASATTTPPPAATGTPPAVATSTPAAELTVTPAPSGDTGIDGMVTLGPMCPVQRIDSPCPDRPYAARITVWRDGTQVAETRSGDDGRFRVILPPGIYRVVGETAGTYPRGSTVDATVVEGDLTPVQIHYDTGIR